MRVHNIREGKVYTTIMCWVVAQRRRCDEAIPHKEKLSQRRAKIKDLLAEGLEQKDICLELNISKRTYIRDRQYLKEQGLI